MQVIDSLSPSSLDLTVDLLHPPLRSHRVQVEGGEGGSWEAGKPGNWEAEGLERRATREVLWQRRGRWMIGGGDASHRQPPRPQPQDFPIVVHQCDCEVTPSTSGRRSKLGSSEADISGYERCSVAETSLVNYWRRRRPSTASFSRLPQDLPVDVDPPSPLRQEPVRVEEGGSWSPGYRKNTLAEATFVDYLGRRRLSIVHGRLSRLSY